MHRYISLSIISIKATDMNKNAHHLAPVRWASVWPLLTELDATDINTNRKILYLFSDKNDRDKHIFNKYQHFFGTCGKIVLSSLLYWIWQNSK